ncbi:MAG: ATP synthase F1 subunit epsilon, partial [Planctomycetota bacterium]
MAKTVRVRVITPHRQVLDEEAVSVQVPAEDGLFGVLAGHAPMISTVEAGILRIRREDSSQSEYIVTRGFAEVGRDQLRLAVDSGEPIDSIDLERAERAAERAK